MFCTIKEQAPLSCDQHSMTHHACLALSVCTWQGPSRSMQCLCKHHVCVACSCHHTIEVCRKELTEEAAKKAAEAAEPDKKGKDKDKKKK